MSLNILLPAHPEANMVNLTIKYNIPLMHIKLSGLTLGLWEKNGKIFLYVFNILGIAENLILLEKNKDNFVTSYKYYDKGMNIKNGSIKNDKISIVYTRDKKQFKPFSVNIFDNNFSALEIFNDYVLHNKTIQSTIIDKDNLNFWNDSKIHNSIIKYGIPFEIISDCTGKSIWIYCGKHKCKTQETLGVILLVFDEKNNFIGIYKYCNMCNKCTQKKSINSCDNIEYC